METTTVEKKENNTKITLSQLDQEKICPICGNRFNTTEKRKIKDQVYIYFIHKIKDDTGKVHIKKCYAGAKESYKYVQKFQNNCLNLKGNPSNYEKYSKFLGYLEDILTGIENEKGYSEFKNEVLKIIWKHEKRLYKKELQKSQE
jgi:hypothetical protein